MAEPHRPEFDAETLDMIRSFVVESLDSLDDNEQQVEHLSTEDNDAYINAIFRAFHTIKGLAGFMNFGVLQALTHEAETFLDLIRKQRCTLDERSIDLIYQLFDAVRSVLKGIETDLTDTAFADQIGPHTAAIHAEATRLTEQQPAAQSSKAEPAPEPAKTLEEEEAEIFALFLEQVDELMEQVEQAVLALEEAPAQRDYLDQAFRGIHNIKGSAGYLEVGAIEQVAMDVETLLEGLRDEDDEMVPIVTPIILNNLEIMRMQVVRLDDPTAPAGAALVDDDTNTLAATTPPEAAFLLDTDDDTGEAVVFGPPPADLPEATAPTRSEEIQPEVAATPSAPVDPPSPAVPPAPKSPAAERSVPKTPTPTPQEKPIRSTSEAKSIRVDMNKLDALFNLVGQLITVESMVVNNPDVADKILPNFRKASAMLNKITRELQEVTLSIRMMPINGLFSKMRRLVRDVSRKAGKQINLEIYGEHTELDKNVMEGIADPLVHIMRNAVDHGIEPTEERIAIGKPEQGHIRLGARYEGSEILIIIEDDGGGLNRGKILDKAVRNGLLTEEDAAELSDHEVWRLIFAPGFSTAEQVTEISGRGVGMDVVKRNIEKLGGSIRIDSQPSMGSRFTLRLPLTLAITDAMLVRVGQSRYALPLLSIRESFRPLADDITVTMDGQEMVRVRDEIYPIIRLHEYFGRTPDQAALDQGILIIVASREQRACLFVDEILGQQQAVIKGLSRFLGSIRGITGCIVLSDGDVGLTLDVDTLVATAHSQGVGSLNAR